MGQKPAQTTDVGPAADLGELDIVDLPFELEDWETILDFIRDGDLPPEMRASMEAALRQSEP